MDPIGSAYAGKNVMAAGYGGKADAALSPTGTASTVDRQIGSASAVAGTQQGIQPQDTRGVEFLPYGSDGKQRGISSSSSPQATPDGKQPTQTAAKKQDGTQVQQEAARLKTTEEQVKTDDTAHKPAGILTGSVSSGYIQGPDGRNSSGGGGVSTSAGTGNGAGPSAATNAAVPAGDQSSAGSSAPSSTAIATTPTGRERTPAEEDAVNGVVARMARSAYSDPAVGDGTRANGASATAHELAGIQAAAVTSLPANSRLSALAGPISSDITGFGPAKLVSIYA